MELSYFNARVRGERGRLLKSADYEVLIKTEGLSGFVDRLRSTSYGPYAETAEARYEARDEVINSALNSSLSDTFESLWKIAPPEARVLLRMVFSIWEVHDIKAIVRGVARGVKRDDIAKSVIPAGEFSGAVINTLLGARDIKDLLAFLDTWGSPYAKPLREGLSEYLRSGSIIEMEIKTDVFVFRYLADTLGKGLNDDIMKENLRLRIDLQNMLTVFKIAGEDFTDGAVKEFFIEGGRRIRLQDVIALSKIKTRDDLLKRLAAMVNEFDIKDVFQSTDPDETGLLEERFEDLVENRLKRLSIVEPLSIALPASYIFMKVREIKNLRMIARAKAFSIPGDELRRLLSYPV